MKPVFKFLLICHLIACASPARTQSHTLWETLATRSDSVFQQQHSVAAAMIVVHPDSTLFFSGFGSQHPDSTGDIRDSHRFAVGSITKTFTALGILRLVAAGKIQLEDEVLALAPELPIRNAWQAESPLKVYHLLEHTAGFDELSPQHRNFPVADDEFPLGKGIDLVKAALQPRWAPGSRFAYSNLGYLVAGHLIEKVSGQSYNEFMTQEVLAPLGMSQSSLRVDERDRDGLVPSFNSAHSPLPYKHIFTRPSGALLSSARDMGQFLRMMLNKGEAFLPQEAFQALERHHSIPAFAHTPNGYRQGLYPRFHHNRLWLGHGGSINKYHGQFEYSHELGLGIFVVASGPGATRCVNSLLQTFHDLLHSAPPLMPDSIAPPTVSDISQFEGFYRLSSPRHQRLYPFGELFTAGLWIDAKENRLSLSPWFGGSETHLVPSGPHRFSVSGTSQDFQYVFASSTELYTALGTRYQKVSIFWMVLLGACLIGALGILAISQFSLIWRIIGFMRRKHGQWSSLLTLEMAATLFWLGAVLFLLAGNVKGMFEQQLISVLLWVCKVGMGLMTGLGLVQLFRASGSKKWGITLGVALGIWMGYVGFWEILR